jgi:acetate kinase
VSPRRRIIGPAGRNVGGRVAIKGPLTAAGEATIPVAISARHVHLTAASVRRLFGAAHALRVHSRLSQPGQFAARETVTLVTRHGQLTDVRVVGPVRSANQIEISRSEAVLLGLEAPLRVSGRLAKTPGIRMVGPAGSVALAHGVVLAKRHIHMSPADARRLGVRDREIVQVAVDTDGRGLIFGDVVVRASPDYQLELHLDTDEGNAAGLKTGDPVRLICPVDARARLHGRPPPQAAVERD